MLRRIAAALLLALFAFAGGFAAQLLAPETAVAQDKPASALKVGVVDLQQLYADYGQTKERLGRLAEKYKAERKDLARRKKVLDAEKEELKNKKLGPEDPAYVRKVKALAERYELLEGELVWIRQAEIEGMRKTMTTLIREILAQVDAYAKANGYDLVVKKSKIDLTSKTVDELMSRVSRVSVVAHSQAVDLTPSVLRQLNR